MVERSLSSRYQRHTIAQGLYFLIADLGENSPPDLPLGALQVSHLSSNTRGR